MTTSLLTRDVQKRPDKVRFNGRILFLTEDPELIKRQLSGEDLQWDRGIKFRDDISTDEITPAYICYYFDDTLGEFPYLGLKAGEEFPITRGSVKGGNFVCSVSGKRRGKGSSREQSPFAEMVAGIQVVVAENIERIYNQNCQNLGLLTTTSFDLIDEIDSGKEIPLSEFTRDADPITRQIIEYDGLFNFNIARLQNKASIPAVTTEERPMTLAEKICARHFIRDLSKNEIGVRAVKPGDSGFVRCDIRFSHEYVTPMAAIFFEKFLGVNERVSDPSSIYFFRDHLTYLKQVITPERKAAGLLDIAEQLKTKQEDFAKRQGIRLHGELSGDRTGSEAICHSKILQSYALPGQSIVGSDSHTTHSGALGCLAFGVGTTDIFNSWITRDVRIRVPESVRIVIKGRKPASVAAKDFMLEILRQPFVRNGEAIGKIVEYSGEAVEALGVDERATMTNMAAEIGAFTGIIAPDQRTVEYLVANRGMSKNDAEELCEENFSDADATYSRAIEIEASSMKPLIALPGDPGNGIRIDDLGKEVKIDIAYGGSCTGGKAEDMDMYAQVFRDALARGRKVHSSVRCYIQFGSQEETPMPEITAPPKWILLLLWPFKGEPCYPQIEGDLSEEFQQRESEHGMSSARRWYYREVCRNLWSMIWRGITIPVIIVPLFCVVLGDFLRWMMNWPWHGLIARIFVDSFPTASIIGLSLGIICSRMLSGHGRLVRLAFGAYQLVSLIMTLVTAQVFGPSPVMRTFLLGLIYLRPIFTLAFFWIGSSWTERRHHHHRSAA